MRLPGASSPCGLAWGLLLLGLSGRLVASQPQMVRQGLGGLGKVSLSPFCPPELTLPHSSLSPPPLEGAPISHRKPNLLGPGQGILRAHV